MLDYREFQNTVHCSNMLRKHSKKNYRKTVVVSVAEGTVAGKEIPP
jgi:hypothetical protein